MNNTTEVYTDVLGARAFGLAFGISSIILGAIGNLLTIIVFSRNPGFQTAFNYFITNLAVLDLVTSIFVLPPSVYGYSAMVWSMGNPIAALQAYSYMCSLYTTSLFLLVITVERFVNIFWPKAYKSLFSTNRVFAVMISSWFIAPAALLPGLVGKNDAHQRLMGWQAGEFICTFVNITGSWKIYVQAVQAIFLILPIGLMFVIHCAMMWKLKTLSKKSKKPRDGDQESCIAETCDLAPKNDLHLTEEEAQLAKTMTAKTKSEKQWSLLKITGAVCAIFSVLVLPKTIISFMLYDGASLSVQSRMIASCITWLQSCVNPFIYVILCPTFKVQYKILLRYVWLKISCKL